MTGIFLSSAIQPNSNATLNTLVIGAGSAITSSGAGGALSAPAFAAFGTSSGTVAQGGVITGAGPTGSATVTPIITYNAAGQLTTVTSATITPAIASVTGLGTGVATLLSGTSSGTGGPAGTANPTLALATVAGSRASGANQNVLTLTDPVTGVQGVGFGDRILWSSNGGGTIAAMAFEVGGLGNDNESQLAFYTQQSAGGGLTRRMTIGYTGLVQMNAYGVGTATFDASGKITSVSDPSQKIILGGYTDGLAAVIAAASDEFMGWHKWRPESGMETEGTYASFFARDNFPIAGAVAKNGERPNSFNDRPVIMALVNAVAELTTRLAALEAK